MNFKTVVFFMPYFFILMLTGSCTPQGPLFLALNDKPASSAGTLISVTPEVNLLQNTNGISAGGSFNFGALNINSTASYTFTIQNTGTGPLSLSGSPIIAVSGTNAADFSITQPAVSTVAAGGSTTFSIVYTASFPPMAKTAQISITNNDSDENLYVVNLTGTSLLSITSASDFTFSNAVNDCTTKVCSNTASANTQSMRPLTLSHDKTLLYTAYINLGYKVKAYNAYSGTEVYTRDVVTASCFPKAAAQHSSGRVYYGMADCDYVTLYQSDLSSPQDFDIVTAAGLTPTAGQDFKSEGVAVSGNYLYVSSRVLGRVYRFDLSAAGDILSLDNSFGTSGYVQLQKSGPSNLVNTDELGQLSVNPSDGSVWAAANKLNTVYRIAPDGSSYTNPLTFSAFAYPYAVTFFYGYYAVSYSSNSGSGTAPHGVGIFSSSYAYVTDLLDSGSEIRNGQGIAADETSGTIFVVDGLFGGPNNYTLPADVGAAYKAQRDLIVKLYFNH